MNIACKSRITILMIAMASMLTGFFSSPAGAASWKPVFQLDAEGSEGRLIQPVFVSPDPELKRFYVADPGSGRLVSYDENGRYLFDFNAGGKIKKPVSLIRTQRGKLWVADRSGNRLLYIDVKAEKIREFSPAHEDGSPLLLGAMALDDQGRLYVLDRSKGVVVRLDDNVQVDQVFIPAAGLRGFCDFKVRNGELWVLDRAGAVLRFSLDGKKATRIPLRGKMQFPVSLDVDGSGLLYILDRHGANVSVFDSRGQFRYAFLSRGRSKGLVWYGAQLNFDWKGRLCVADEGNSKVEVFSQQ